MKKVMSFDDINPFVRYAHLFIIEPESPFKEVIAYDNRLMYVCDGEGSLVIAGTRYEARKGALFLWRPGTTYSLCSALKGRLTMIGINFDYCFDASHIPYPIVPDRAKSFVPENITELAEFTDLPALNQPLHLRNMATVENLLLDLTNEFLTRKRCYSHKVRGSFLTILGEVGRYSSTIKGPDSKTWHQKIDLILQYIHDHYSEPISNNDIASFFNFHPVYINRMMVKHTGLSLHHYLINYRITEAISLLQTTNWSIADIATKVGFLNSNYFSKCFKKIVGTSPSKYSAKSEES